MKIHHPFLRPDPQITSEVVERAIADGELLIQAGNAVSGVDRIHTALHGYLLAVCDAEVIAYNKDATITALFKLLRSHHPKLQNLGTRSNEIEKILMSFATILDSLNPIRNKASVAHPNGSLLNEEEAMLVINVVRTVLHYLDSKFVTKPS